MADKEQETGQENKGSSLKDDILQKIRQQEELQRETGATAGGASPRPPSVAGGGVTGSKRGFFGANLHRMSVYCRQLATLIDVGIPLLRSLRILGERSTDKTLRNVSLDLARRVEEGQPLSTAMLAHGKVFSPSFVGVVRAGEAGGILEDSLRRLADLLERRSEIRRRIISSMIYPLIALMVELIVIGIVVFYALPQLMKAYPNPDDLPALTRGLLNFSTYVTTNWMKVVIMVVGVIVVAMLYLKSSMGRRQFDWLLLRLPIFGNVVRKLNVARFSRTLGSLIASGIPLIAALRVTADTSDNDVVERTLQRVGDTVERGGKMEEPMRSEPIFDPMVVDMVMVGDEAGALDAMLLKIADTYDVEVDIKLRTLTSIIEPVLIVCLGFAVGLLALAVFQPYFNLVNSKSLTVQ
ncbi:MAG: type II secretion system F family protein [Candidatus Sumerlaeaceae bacterium]|nr:type II secretion system F family protein [Candidatus Sumerlaeaceae bacterium]